MKRAAFEADAKMAAEVVEAISGKVQCAARHFERADRPAAQMREVGLSRAGELGVEKACVKGGVVHVEVGVANEVDEFGRRFSKDGVRGEEVVREPVHLLRAPAHRTLGIEVEVKA